MLRAMSALGVTLRQAETAGVAGFGHAETGYVLWRVPDVCSSDRLRRGRAADVGRAKLCAKQSSRSSHTDSISVNCYIFGVALDPQCM